MKTRALAPWFGSNRMLAHEVGAALKGCRWVGVPFAGGMCELTAIQAPSIVVSDLHRHVINLALVVATHGEELQRELNNVPFHPDMLSKAQEFCKAWDGELGNLEAAFWYFIACWMGRSHKAGIDDQFNGGLSVRWNGNGGDSNTRYRSAVESLDEWMEIMRRCNFVVQDVFDFLERCEDTEGHGIYCDPPFPGPGDRYKHKFTEAQHRQLAAKLATFNQTRIVCRFYDHPLIRELYPAPHWTWQHLEGRKQSNDKAPEVLIYSSPEQQSLFPERP